MALICAEGHTVPFVVELSSDGKATVTEQMLCLRFRLRQSSLFLEQEIVDESGIVRQTVFQLSVRTSEGVKWILGPGQYRVFGEVQTQTAQPTSLTPETNTSITKPTSVRVKVECVDAPVYLLSDSSDDDVKQVFGFESLHTKNKQPEPNIIHSAIVLEPLDSSTSHSPLPSAFCNSLSVVDSLKLLSTKPGAKNELRNVDYDALVRKKVRYLPSSFDGDVLFELPPSTASTSTTIGRLMDGMDKKYDGHPWCITKTSNIKNDSNLTFRRSACIGHLQCQNDSCQVFLRSSNRNETEWEGNSQNPSQVGRTSTQLGSSIICRICKMPPVCLYTCNCRMYYILPRDPNMTRACIHFGNHKHPVSDGTCRVTLDSIRTLVGEEVRKSPGAKNSAIALAVSKEFLSSFLLRDDHDTSTVLQGPSLNEIMDRYKVLSSPNVRNMISSFRMSTGGKGYVDNILELKRRSKYDFVQDSVFPGQGSSKVYLFKMSTDGPGSGVDLVKRMQPGGDLEHSWIMFDHVKRVKDWTTMACHVYDTVYCKVMTIAVCDMQSEDTESQSHMWIALNSVMAKYGVPNPQFKGFMADSAQANWNAVRIIYGSGDPKIPMENSERSCLLHWTVSLDRHTKKLIKSELQDQHIKLCKQYKDAATSEEADNRYSAIKAWWLSSGAATEEGLRELDDWLGFWHFRYRQWGGFMHLGFSLDELAEMPSCNLSETVHNKWLQQSGNRGTDLYVATVDDYIRAFQQSTNYHAYLKGHRSGTGPDKDELKLRAARRLGDPKKIAEAVGCYGGVEFNSRIPHLEGEEIFGSAKRKLDLPPGSDGDSHRHDKVNYSQPRVVQTRATRARMEENLPHNYVVETANVLDQRRHVARVAETNCDKSSWHIARLPARSAKMCSALQSHSRDKCKAKIVRGGRGTPAPTYTGRKIQYGSNLEVLVDFWFCADDIERCVRGHKRQYVIDWPEVPTTWPVQVGTNLTREEILSLEEAGFQLTEQLELSPRRLFGGPSSSILNHTMHPKPPNAGDYPTTRFGKAIRRNPKAPTVDHHNKWESARNLKAQVKNTTQIPYPGFGVVLHISSGISPNQNEYQVTICNFPACSCPDFVSMSAAALGKQGKWVHCKHIYYILRYLCKVHCHDDQFIHAPSYSYNEIEYLLVGAKLIKKSSI